MFSPEAAFLITASEFHQTVKAEISVNNFLSSGFTIHNKKIATNQVTGVVTTIPFFLKQEFYYIEPADRDYVCAEMNAFFIYFLSQLDCKKINPPSKRTLTGLSMHKIELLKTLQELKIPLWPVHLKNGNNISSINISEFKRLKCTLIGNVIIPDEIPEKITGYMRLVSQAFALPYLSAFFISPAENDYFLVDIITIPNINEDAHQAGIVNYFLNPV